ncbi:MAG: hypothetical protein V1772_12865 [Chloroflexota bacterium]
MMQRLRGWVGRHPRLANWLVLAVGMVAIFLWAARGQELTFGQTLGLAGACVLLAGACVWIIGWE